MLPSQWINSNVYVTGERQGLIKLDPFQVPIVDTMADPLIKLIILMMSSQGVGKSTTLVAIIAWFMEHVDASSYFMFSCTDHRKDVVTNRLQPTLHGTAATRRMIKWTRPGQIPLTEISYGKRPPHTKNTLKMTTAGSVGAGHSSTAKLVMADEVDDYRNIRMARSLIQRSVTMQNTKTFLSSTPSRPDESPTADAYYDGSMGDWTAVCVHCDRDFILEEHHIHKETSLVCPGGCVWTEQDRVRSVSRGYYNEMDPDNPVKSFHASQLCSLSVPLHRTIEDMRLSRNDPQHIATQIMGKPYEDIVDEIIGEGDIKRCAGPPFVPYYITAGVDCQGSPARYEWGIDLWSRNLQEMHLARTGMDAIGTDDAESMWDMLKHVHSAMQEVIATYETGPLPYRIGIDVAYRTNDLLAAAALNGYTGREHEDWELLRGHPNEGGQFNKAVRGTWNMSGYQHVYTGSAKRHLATAQKQGRFTVNSILAPSVIKQLTAEKLIRIKSGTAEPRMKWIPKGPNEQTDIAVYAYAQAVHLLVYMV